MAYNVFACETVTGKTISKLDVLVKSWKRELNGTDTASVQLAPGALTVASRDQYRLITTPQRMTMVIEWVNPGDAVGTPVFAAPIQNRAWDGATVTINAVGIRQGILDSRKIITPTPPYATQSQTWNNMQLGSIGVKIVQFVTAQPGYGLPIIFPSIITDTDATHTRTYKGFDLKTASSALTDLTNVINGPDFDFTPVWADANRSAIQYKMRTGTTAQPQLFSPNYVSFDATRPKSSVKKLTYLDDASTLVTREWGNGSGNDVNTLMSTATSTTLTAAGWPALEGQKDYKTEIKQTTLDSAVQGDLAAHSNVLVQWSLESDGTQPPLLGSYLLGDKAMVNVQGHLWIPDSPPQGYPMRIIALAGDSSTTVKHTVQGA